METELFDATGGSVGQSQKGTQGLGHRAALLWAGILVFVLREFVPYGATILYPFTLLATWVHEMGHGVTALALGGSFQHLEIYKDASGLAYTASIPGWRQAAVSAGGLLAPPLVGALLVALGRRLARPMLTLLSLGLLLSLVLWVRTVVGFLAMVPLLLLIGFVTMRASNAGRLFLSQLLGLTLGLDTVGRIGYFFAGKANGIVGNRPSDISGITKVLGGTQTLWGGLLAGIALTLLALALYSALRAPKQVQRAPVFSI